MARWITASTVAETLQPLPAADPPLPRVRSGTSLRRSILTLGSGDWLGVVLLGFIVIVALGADRIAPTDPFALTGASLQAPGRAHPMGTDALGRDVFSAVVHGARASGLIALTAGILIGGTGLLVGVVGGYLGGRVDTALLRLTELVQVLPRFFLAIVVVAVLGPGIDRVVIVLGLTSWPDLSRIVRAEVASLRSSDHIAAARVLGAGTPRILRHHVAPAVLPVTIAVLSLAVAQVLLVEASLGFVGLSDPSVMTWGLLAGNARDFIRSGWWLALFPGLAVTTAVLGLNLTGDLIAARIGGRRAQR